MSARAPATRRLRRMVRKGARRAAARTAEVSEPSAMAPVTGACTVRSADQPDTQWQSVEPGPYVVEQHIEADGEEGLAFVLRVVEEEFVAAGRSYPAAAAREARRKLASATAVSDIPDGFHPALWPHIRRIENRIAASYAAPQEQVGALHYGRKTP